MRRIVLYTLLFLSLSIIAQQRDTIASPQQSPYGCAVEFAYQPHDRTLTLVSSPTSITPIAVLERDFSAPFFSSLGKSPDCRYIAASVGESYAQNETVIWDLATMRRVGSFAGESGKPASIEWSTYEASAVIRTTTSAYHWDFNTNEQALFTVWNAQS